MVRRRRPQPTTGAECIQVRGVRDGSELCLRCGLCCDGTLFMRADLEPGEEEFAESLGLAVQPGRGGEPGNFQLPCTAFIDGRCSVYERGRPARCGSYRCNLLRRYVDGTNALDEVLPIVHLVRSLTR